MGKHLSYEDKHKQFNMKIENKKKIKELIMLRRSIYPNNKEEYEKEYARITDEIYAVMRENRKITQRLDYAKKSKYNGCYGENGVCNNVFGKKVRDLTNVERQEYNKIMKRLSRSREV